MALHQLRALLFDPATFFENYPPRKTVGMATAVVLGVAALIMAGTAVIGRLFAARIDATYTETVMEPWSDAQCSSFEEMGAAPEQCQIDEPVTREVDVGAELWSEILRLLPLVFLSLVVVWLLIALALHVLSALFDARGGFGATLSAVGWGMVLELVSTAIGLGVIAATLYGTEFASDPELLLDQLEALTGGGPSVVSTLGTVLVALWQAYIWTYGLSRARSLAVGEAAIATAPVALVVLLLSL